MTPNGSCYGLVPGRSVARRAPCKTRWRAAGRARSDGDQDALAKGTDEAGARNASRTSAVRAARVDRLIGLRPNEGGARNAPVPDARADGGRGGVGGCLHGAQHPAEVASRQRTGRRMNRVAATRSVHRHAAGTRPARQVTSGCGPPDTPRRRCCLTSRPRRAGLRPLCWPLASSLTAWAATRRWAACASPSPAAAGPARGRAGRCGRRTSRSRPGSNHCR